MLCLCWILHHKACPDSLCNFILPSNIVTRNHQKMLIFFLQILPTTGIIKPSQMVEVSICHEDFCTKEEFLDGIAQNWWCEDTRDKEAILLVKITGCCSTDAKTHRVRVRHCLLTSTYSTTKGDSEGTGTQSNLLHRADFVH